VIVSLIVLSILGGILALVAEFSVSLALNRPVFGRRLNPLLWRVGVVQGKETLLTGRTLSFGFGLLLTAHMVLATFSLSVGAFLWPALSAILTVDVIWLIGILGAITHLPWSRGFKKVLTTGDPDYDYAVLLARMSGIPLQSVGIVRGSVRTRQPKFARTICLSQSEREELSEQDRRVLIAERIGALRFIKPASRGTVLAAIQTTTLAALLTVVLHGVGVPWLMASLTNAAMFLVFSCGFHSRLDNGNNDELDRFILEATGDLTTVELAVTNQFALMARSEHDSYVSRAARDELSKRLEMRKANLLSVAQELNLPTRLPS